MALNFLKSKEERLFAQMDDLYSNPFVRDRKIVELIEGAPVASLDTPAQLNINAQDKDGNTFLHKYGSLTILKNTELSLSDSFPADVYLLAKGADANILNNKGETPLKKLVSGFSDEKLNKSEISDHTALIEATSKENLNKIYPDGETILTDFAANNYHISQLKPVFEAFVRAGADVNAPNAKGQTPLRVLLDRLVEYNLRQGALFESRHDVLSRKRFKTKELSIAAFYFIQNGAKITLQDNQLLSYNMQKLDKTTAQYLDLLEILTDLGTNYSSLSDSAKTEIAQKQLKKASQIDDMLQMLWIEDKSIINTFTETFATLLQDTNVKDDDGCTLLFDMLETGNQHGVDVLIKRGADIDAVANDGSTPLHLAAFKGNTAVVDYILKNGKTPVNAQTNSGYTPLHVARGEKKLFEVLVKAGADWNIQDNEGKTPLDTLSDTDIKIYYLSEMVKDLQSQVKRSSQVVAKHKRKTLQKGNQNQKG